MSATSPEAKARRAISKAAYYHANKERLASLKPENYSRAYYLANKDKIKGYMKSVRSGAEYKAKESERRVKERDAEAPQREARRLEREAILEQAKAERAARRERERSERKALRSATVAASRGEMLERKKAKSKLWRIANADKLKVDHHIYMKAYKKTEKGREVLLSCRRRSEKNPKNKAIKNQRKRLQDFVKRTGSRVHLRFGCSPDFIRAHIEKQFTKGMTWENYGAWHIDHIMPCAQFDLSNQMHADICFNWQNLRPLWADENHAKSDTITHPQLCLPIAA